MKLKLTILFFFLTHSLIFSQVSNLGYNTWMAKEFSKEIALYGAKKFLFKDVLGSTPVVDRFEVIPLAAASSGELTTLLYKCESKEKEGLVLGFYGNYWNDAGVVYRGFGFKNFEKNKATEFLDKIQNAINENWKYLKEGYDNNIFFKYDDVDVLVCASEDTYTIRLFWNDFDSSWERSAFERSKKRFEKKIK